ncbi:DNA gyrase inhibitor YacG [Herbaspirillum sp. RTI4]|uniref:DNA gyrase inhibitor YacG n=1 Tax=Herbaspirillum sp. RTI4 TaxID=3048640 RepID=UPI002AB50C33|nr:DNA gyrase inhibitor YacG [Herbaspirillum sp. RTI4]MDY7577493.1 DNA gyrase inhibitor YacG [Herbaspirillum sp. RTI4]MEA9980968.1 DNA gyrase inhibitor YacG [Herbaspirillum sp. RTI4]
MATIVDCPTCAAKVEWNEINKFRPFCSNRCKQIDLGAWAEEKYTIPAVNMPTDDDSDSSLQSLQ